jgi:hypothetical protein
MRRLRMARISSGSIDLNELAYTEFLLSIDVRSSSGKVAFNVLKGYKNKDYIDGNAAIAYGIWRRSLSLTQLLLWWKQRRCLDRAF